MRIVVVNSALGTPRNRRNLSTDANTNGDILLCLSVIGSFILDASIGSGTDNGPGNGPQVTDTINEPVGSGCHYIPPGP